MRVVSGIGSSSTSGIWSSTMPIALEIFHDGICAVDAGLNITKFYRHESCGKCTPCREGGRWMEVLLQKLEDGHGTRQDIADLKSIAGQILGRSLCALGDAAAMPVLSILERFPDEFEHHVATGKCVVNRRRTAVEAHRHRSCRSKPACIPSRYHLCWSCRPTMEVRRDRSQHS